MGYWAWVQHLTTLHLKEGTQYHGITSSGGKECHYFPEKNSQVCYVVFVEMGRLQDKIQTL